MRFSISCAAALASCLWVVSVAAAQPVQQATDVDTATVTAVDAAANTFTVGTPAGPQRYAVADVTLIRVGSAQIPLAELTVGDRVVVTATREGATSPQVPVAQTVEVVQRHGAPVSAGPPATGSERVLRSSLRDAGGKTVGEATFRETPNGVLLHVALHDLPAGEHGFHVHEKGVCTPPFESAGAHLATGTSAHGFLVEDGPHAGDLPNLYVGRDGRVEAELLARDLPMDAMQDADGAALVVHEKADDHRSHPAGDAGGRIACGVIGTGQER